MSESDAIEPEVVRPLPAGRDAPRRAFALKDAIRDFLSRSTSEHTRAAYGRAILEFTNFVGKHLLTVGPGDVAAWRGALLKAGQSNQTVAAKLSAVRSLYAYLIKAAPGALAVNPADAQLVPPPKIPNALKGRALTAKEVRHMLASPDRKKTEGARDYAILLVMLRLALRVSEVGRMKESSVGWNSGRWTLTLKVKGGREELWPLPADVKEAIDEYLKLDKRRRSLLTETRRGDQFVFQPSRNHRTGVNNRGLTRQMICRIVRKWASFAGVKGDVTPHDLRRTAITRALSQGKTYREVQMMSKHRDPKTVMRYDYERDNLERNPVVTLSYEDE